MRARHLPHESRRLAGGPGPGDDHPGLGGSPSAAPADDRRRRRGVSSRPGPYGAIGRRRWAGVGRRRLGQSPRGHRGGGRHHLRHPGRPGAHRLACRNRQRRRRSAAGCLRSLRPCPGRHGGGDWAVASAVPRPSSTRKAGPMRPPATTITTRMERCMPSIPEPLDSGGLLRLMSWLSPSFPVGSFSYSHGIEQAVEAGFCALRTMSSAGSRPSCATATGGSTPSCSSRPAAPCWPATKLAWPPSPN